MNTPNPLIPQGSLQQQAQTRSTLRVTVFSIIALHVVLLGGLLFQGCRRSDKSSDLGTGASNELNSAAAPSPIDTNWPPHSPLGSNDLGYSASNLNTSGSYTAGGPASTNLGAPYTPPGNLGQPINPAPATPEAGLPIPSGEGHEYTVAKGDTLAVIARKNGVSVKAIEAANPGIQPTRLKVGQKIQIPASSKPVLNTGVTPTTTSVPATASRDTAPSAEGGSTYTVKSGDSLTKIAKAHGTTPKALRTLNHLKSDRITVGQKLKVPAKTAGTTNRVE